MSCYICSRHNRYLELATIKYWTPKGRQSLEYYRCPEPGCDYAKPNKYQLKPYSPRKPRLA